MTSILNQHELLEGLQELQRRSEHGINTYIPSEMEEHNQLSFHKTECRYRLLFGGNQSGKSHAAAFEIACWARGSHPYRNVPSGDIFIWVISAEYVTIYTGIYRHLRNIIPDWDVIKNGPNVPGHNIPSYILVKRQDGSTAEISFMSAKGENRQKFQAAAVHLISIDEEIQGDLWEELQARTLATGGEFIVSATLVESYDWITDMESRGEDESDPEVFLTRLNTTKNPYLDKATVDHLVGTWSEETKAYRIYGKSRRTSGLVYNTFTRGHVIENFPIPFDWPKFCAIDPGIRTCAVLWIAIGPDERAYAYRELYLHDTPLYEVAMAIRYAEGYKLHDSLSYKFAHFVWDETDHSERMVRRVIDDKTNSRLITGDEGVMTQLHLRYGILCSPAEKGLRAGIETCRWWLDKDKEGKFKFSVFKRCEHFVNEIKYYRLRPKSNRRNRPDPADEPVRKDNHLMDCWRYIAILNPKHADKVEMYPDRPTKKNIVDRIREKRERESVHEYLGSEY